MATIQFTLKNPAGSPVAGAAGIYGLLDPGVYIVEWVLANGDKGLGFRCPGFTERAVQLTGTPGAAGQTKWEGTWNPSEAAADPADAEWSTLNDEIEVALVSVAAALPHTRKVLENPFAIRPNIVAGDGTTAVTARLTVVKLGRR